MIIYVDDIIIIKDDKVELSELKKKLFQVFEMKNLERLKYFLWIEVLRSNQGIFISQRTNILDLLVDTRMINYKPIETIMANHGL